ncbi:MULTISPECIES: regulatory protein RecX [Empedobacter]|uniref:Regulatory protein RecX n=1 Tax=Empedobacter falsenii TaxID=343874 RepID=A0A427BN10_9FLAO|nr:MULTISPECIES: regulatory protein RecX [Empedobacter]MDH0675384.1 RecX family transcriptional regulator [Empedobacter sp. GD03861]RRT91048.1 RecX family transcriptional regulator [Empedobacter falsenii]RRT91094.1 RecX family transcriptional regulator [Empedobacter falsenii]
MNFSKDNPKKIYTIDEIKDKMAKYCLYQDRCHWEVEKKLRDFDLIPEAKDEILFKLIHYGFLNEERFVHNFVRGKVNQKMWGRNRLRQELKMRQIDQKLIEKAFKEEIDLDKYWNNLLYLTQKKFNLLASERESFKKINKVKAYLAYKGYEFDLMNDAIETVKTKE